MRPILYQIFFGDRFLRLCLTWTLLGFGIAKSLLVAEDQLGVPTSSIAVEPGTVDAELLSELRGPIRDSWVRYESQEWNGVIAFDQVLMALSLPQGSKKIKWETHVRNRSMLSKQTDSLRLDCLNDIYNFSLSKSDASGGYQIADYNQNVTQGSDAENMDSNMRGLCRYTYEVRNMAIGVWWVSLLYILDHESPSGFVLDRLEEIEVDGNKQVVIGFIYRGSRILEKNCFPNSRYWAVLDPNNHWKVLRSGVEGMSGKSEGSLRVVTWNEYDANNPYCPSATKYAWEEAGEGIEELKKTECTLRNAEPASVEEYYLPYYGFSEPSNRPQNGRRLLLVASAIAVFFATWLFRRSQSPKT